MDEEIENISFTLTREQAEKICNHFGEDYNDLNEYEICEYLDKIIDEL